MLINTLFYRIFYPDTGARESYHTENLCLHSSRSRQIITNSMMCRWDSNDNCQMIPPSLNFDFFIIIITIIILITIPFTQLSIITIIFNINE